MRFRCPARFPGGLIVVAFLLLLFSPTVDAAESDDSKTPLPLWQAVALGVIEGATEYLPVSSTGHLLIFQHWLGLRSGDEESEAAHSLAICIQIGAILAVVMLYFPRLLQMFRGLFGGDPAGRKLLFHLIIAFLPAAAIGLLFGRLIKEHLFSLQSVIAALIVGAVLIFVSAGTQKGRESTGTKEMSDMRWWDALAVGLMQCIAFWPGFSRSLATILGCRSVGLRLGPSVEFSFLLGLITLSAATAKEGLDHGSKIIEYYGVVSPLISLVVAFVFAVISVRFMVGLLNRYGLMPFGFYRLLLAGLCLTML